MQNTSPVDGDGLLGPLTGAHTKTCTVYSYDSTLQDIVDAILPELAVEDARAQRDFHLERKEPVPAAVLEKIASAAPQPVEEPQSPVKRQRTGDAAKSKMQYDDIVTFHLVPDEGW